ncbi:MAG: c-type cytochrome [Chitinophagales bacterium]|nr:c-type cytochrome [Chitinophagales bacterium]
MNSTEKKFSLIAPAVACSIFLQAQDAAAPVATNPATDNSMLYVLLAAAAVLLLAVLLLGTVLVRLTRLVYEKKKLLSVILLLLPAAFLSAQDAGQGKAFQLFSNPDLVMGAVVIAAELFAILWLLIRINSLVSELSESKQEETKWNFHLPRFFDTINASVAVEKEKDILLDHNYDGIRELDNSLPPWWKYSFYISIVWAVLYIGYYYFGGGPSSTDEYNTEVQLAQIQVEEYKKKNALNVDENNVQLADVAGIAEGKDLYKTNCAACHGNAGEGIVGPNLTDNYWIHGGSLNEVYKSIKYGWPAKGMKSWETDFSAVQIKNLVGYIHSINGTNPANAKAPEGELMNQAGTTVTDSATVAAAAAQK